MNYVFLMDPLEKVIVKKDTSLALMVGADRKGHKVHFLSDGGMVVKGGKLQFHVREVLPQFDEHQPFVDRGERILSQDDVDVIFVRNDPPFDDRYLHNTWLLDLLPEHVAVLNHPSGIRTANEKIWASRFTSIVPPTLIGCNQVGLFAFLEQEKDVIAKPTDSFGGQSVFRVSVDGRNTKVIFETLTQNWTRDIILQKYIPEAEEGDKRVLLLDGEPLGAVLRYHSEDDHRNNFFAGGKPLASAITARDREIIAVLKPELKELGLYFVGIDIIGDYLIEVNVTSPTCLQEMNRLYQCQLEDQVIAFSQSLAEQLASKKDINMPELKLFYKPTCSYCNKVLSFMGKNDISLAIKNVSESSDIRNELIAIGGKGQVPCLIIDGKALYESNDIIQWFKDNREKK